MILRVFSNNDNKKFFKYFLNKFPPSFYFFFNFEIFLITRLKLILRQMNSYMIMLFLRNNYDCLYTLAMYAYVYARALKFWRNTFYSSINIKEMHILYPLSRKPERN